MLTPSRKRIGLNKNFIKWNYSLAEAGDELSSLLKLKEKDFRKIGEKLEKFSDQCHETSEISLNAASLLSRNDIKVQFDGMRKNLDKITNILENFRQKTENNEKLSDSLQNLSRLSDEYVEKYEKTRDILAILGLSTRIEILQSNKKHLDLSNGDSQKIFGELHKDYPKFAGEVSSRLRGINESIADIAAAMLSKDINSQKIEGMKASLDDLCYKLESQEYQSNNLTREEQDGMICRVEAISSAQAAQVKDLMDKCDALAEQIFEDFEAISENTGAIIRESIKFIQSDKGHRVDTGLQSKNFKPVTLSNLSKNVNSGEVGIASLASSVKAAVAKREGAFFGGEPRQGSGGADFASIKHSDLLDEISEISRKVIDSISSQDSAEYSEIKSILRQIDMIVSAFKRQDKNVACILTGLKYMGETLTRDVKKSIGKIRLDSKCKKICRSVLDNIASVVQNSRYLSIESGISENTDEKWGKDEIWRDPQEGKSFPLYISGGKTKTS